MARTGCYSAIYSLELSVHKKPTYIATCSLSPLHKRVLLSLYLLRVLSSVRPPNYNTLILLSELMVTHLRQLPDCVGSLREMPRGVKCCSVITRFNVLYVRGTPDCMGSLTQYHVQC
jgi:hypothetical protein